MQQPAYFIAIDIGTSFIKGAIVDLESHQLLHIQRQPFPHPVDKLAANFFEVDPAALVAAIRRLLDGLLPVAPNCRGLVTCTQMHGLVLTDLAHRPLTNVITWRDQRAVLPHPSGAGSYYDQLLARLTAEEQAELGGGLRAGLPVGTLFWLAENQQLPNEPTIPLTLAEFVLTQLCPGQSTPAIEPTNAAGYGTYHLGKGEWHQAVLQKLGLDQLMWPPIGSIHSMVGVMAHSGETIPCYASVGDHQCALAGAFLQPRELSLNVSTGSQASLVTSSLLLGNYETRPYFDGQFLNTIVKIPAGRSLSVLVDLLTELAGLADADLGDPWVLISQAVDQVPQTDLAINLAFYDSADGHAGAITNAREDNLSVGHLFRAAFQSMAVNYYQCGQRIAASEEAWDRIVFSGGLVTKFTALRETILQRFQCDYRLCLQEEDTLLGLMTLAMTIDGQTSTVAEAARVLSTENQ